MQEPETILPSYGCSSPDSSSFDVSKTIQVKLIDEGHLWTQFNQLGTEMIVTKPGRQMFPTIKVLLQNLNPFVYYKLYMEVIPVGTTPYKFEKGKWYPKQSDSSMPSSWLQHPQSPAEGFKWMLKPVDFNVRLTNCIDRIDKETLWLRSMHKYMIVIHVEEGSNITQRNPLLSRAFPFPETSFFAVTTYQNPLVKELKIEKNIHAKGARLKRLKLSEYSDENISEKFSGNFKRSRLDFEPSASPLKPENRTTDHSLRLSTSPIPATQSPWNETCNKPADFVKWSNPYLSSFFGYHRIPNPTSIDRIPFSTPLATPYCSPPCLHCERSQNYNTLFPMHPQSFSFGNSSSPSFITGSWPTYSNRVIPPNIGCTPTPYRLHALHVCHTCRKALSNCGECIKSNDVNANDYTAPSSTTDVELPSSSIEIKGVSTSSQKSDSTAPEHCPPENENSSISDTSSENCLSTMEEFSSSIAEAIKSSGSPVRSDSPLSLLR